MHSNMRVTSAPNWIGNWRHTGASEVVNFWLRVTQKNRRSQALAHTRVSPYLIFNNIRYARLEIIDAQSVEYMHDIG